MFLRPCAPVAEHMLALAARDPLLQFRHGHAEQDFFDWCAPVLVATSCALDETRGASGHSRTPFLSDVQGLPQTRSMAQTQDATQLLRSVKSHCMQPLMWVASRVRPPLDMVLPLGR